MGHFSDIFERIDLQHISDYLLFGTDNAQYSTKGYKERIEEYHKPFTDCMESKFPDEKELDEVMDKIYGYCDEVIRVYLEVGLQCGLKLAMQMILNLDKE